MNILNVPVIGKIFWVASASSAYYTMLLEAGVHSSEIATGLVAGEDMLTTLRNDVLLVTPGDYVETAICTWDKSQTHMVGLGGPNLRVQPTTLTPGGLRFSTVSNIPAILRVDGNYCQFHNIATFNNGVYTTALADLQIVGKNNFFKRCDFRGGNNSTQNTATTPYAGVPINFMYGAGYGNGTTLEECQIGSAGNAVRTHGPGAVLFLGGASSAAFDVKFKRCTLETYCQTLGTDVGLVKLNVAGYSVDRYLLFDECFFYNFWEGNADKMNYAIVDSCTTTHQGVIRRCTAAGIEFWSNNASFIFADMPDVADSGGIVEGVKAS